MRGYVPEQQRQFERELRHNPALAGRILQELPPVEVERERIIRCLPEKVNIAVARAAARAVVQGELWRVEIVR